MDFPNANYKRSIGADFISKFPPYLIFLVAMGLDILMHITVYMIILFLIVTYGQNNQDLMQHQFQFGVGLYGCVSQEKGV